MKKNNKIYIIILILLIIVTTIYIYLYKTNTLKEIELRNMGYSKESISTFLNDTENINKYSKLLEEIIKKDLYNSKYLNDYLDIDYRENKDYIININSLLDKGYTGKEINQIYNNYSDNDIKYIINTNYNENIFKIYKINYYKKDYLERYLTYLHNNNKLDIDKAITYVNINLDYEFYTHTKEVDNPNDLLVLVNKYNYLNKDFVPENLEEIPLKYSVKNQKLKKDAKEAFIKMLEDAKKEDIVLYAGSGYRSYDYQNNLYNNYVLKDGPLAETYSARAGFSEHQTALAVDILNKDYTYIKIDSMEYSWLISNCYKYGFILRYPENKEHITGYINEPWHYRYIGVIAEEIMTKNLTYEEYLALKKDL